MAAEHEAYEGAVPDDALLAAIMGEPLPPGSAEAADVALLRERMGVIGRVLSEPPGELPGERPSELPGELPGGPSGPPGRVPAAVPRRRRHRRHVVLGALAVAGAGAFLSGLAWLVTQTGPAGSADAGADSAADSSGKEAAAPFGSPRYLACARLVAEATVTGVEPVPGAGGLRITARITRQYVPEKPSGEVTFLTEETLGVGDRVLFGLPAHGGHPDALFVGEAGIAAERARVTAALPASRTLACE
ncbi:hypothetical protein AB0G32_22715 [Streptomyces sp. NPDC023723]|uniref:hypothetical protein n=1 Tax=Streptomyces sp. NPDC023723 TaxID=3154323 RepID=UPI0033D32266